MKEGFIAEWHDLDADFLYSVPFLVLPREVVDAPILGIIQGQGGCL